MASRFAIVPIGLLVGWALVSQRWYVCHIKQACEAVEPAVVVSTTPLSPESIATVDAGPAPVQAEAPPTAAVESPAVEPEARQGGDAAMPIEGATLLFPYGNASADASINAEIASLAERLSGSKMLITIIGHTDSQGTAEFNLALGLKRAMYVRDALAARGISLSQMNVRSEGETSPAATNDTDAGQRQNRRVDVRVDTGARSL